MAFDDILLHLQGYPEPTSEGAIARAVGFAALVRGKLTALAVDVRFPVRSNWLADSLIGLSGMAHEQEAKSEAGCRLALERFEAKAKAAGVFQERLLETSSVYEVPEHVAGRARTRDLCIVPMSEGFDGREQVAESVIFNSGRPALLFGEKDMGDPPVKLDVVVLAWDGSRCSARAMAEAMPILVQAGEVRVLTVVNEKATAVAQMGTDALRHLAAHGVRAVSEEIDAAGRPIGEVLDRYLQVSGAGLLVMGAYGHTRLREFIFGGATAHMLRNPRVPVLMAH
jgi:nucleotide-binding universal stress UspA family protein